MGIDEMGKISKSGRHIHVQSFSKNPLPNQLLPAMPLKVLGAHIIGHTAYV